MKILFLAIDGLSFDFLNQHLNQLPTFYKLFANPSTTLYSNCETS